MSETSDVTEAFARAQADLDRAEQDRAADPAAVTSAEVAWADAAELYADDLERRAEQVPAGLRAQVDAIRERTAAG